MRVQPLRLSLVALLLSSFIISLFPLAYAAQSSGTQGTSGVRRRPEPPPFDRPPMVSDQNDPDRSSTAPPDYSGTQPSRAPVLQRPPASESRNPSRTQSTGQDSGYPGDSDNRAGRERPVLRRPSDSRDDSTAPSRGGSVDDRPMRTPQGSGGQSPNDDDQVVKLESTLVNIPLLVSDRSGRYLPQLTKNDFVLYEDGKQQEIASFGTEEVPFNVALLLDVSPSVEGNIRDIQDAALAFVRQLRAQDRVMVVSFDRLPHFLTDFTSDRRQLEYAIHSAAMGSGTSVYDAVFETVRQKMRGIDGRKALILFSDGEDTTSSHASYDDAIASVSESDVLVYGLRYLGAEGGYGRGSRNPWPRSPIPNIPFPLPFPWPFPRGRRGPFTLTQPGSKNMTSSAAAQNWPRRRNRGGDFMADISEAGGGPVFDAEQVGDLSRLANKIAEELRHVYVISYYPSNPLSNGGYRAIRIRVKNRDDIAVRHRRGYNAKEVGSGQHT